MFVSIAVFLTMTLHQEINKILFELLQLGPRVSIPALVFFCPQASDLVTVCILLIFFS